MRKYINFYIFSIDVHQVVTSHIYVPQDVQPKLRDACKKMGDEFMTCKYATQAKVVFSFILLHIHHMLNICAIFINQYCLYCDFSSRITSQQISKVNFHPAGSSSEISIAVFRSYETGQRGWQSARRRTPQIC